MPGWVAGGGKIPPTSSFNKTMQVNLPVLLKMIMLTIG